MPRKIAITITVDNRKAINNLKAQAIANKDLREEQKHLNDEARKAQIHQAKLNNQYKKTTKSTKDYTNETRKAWHVSNGLTNSFIKGNLAARGITAAVNTLTGSVRSGANAFVEYDFAVAKIEGITQSTAQQMGSLEEVIRGIGASSIRTASEVAETALEMSKLGLSQGEIEDVLDSVISLSVAFDEQASLVGETVVQVLNAYNKTASETEEVTDTLAKTFASSSLNLEKFRTAFSFVGGTAKVSGVDLQELSAIMGILSDRGIKLSTVGTQLRRIFTLLSITNGAAAQAIGITDLKSEGLAGTLEALSNAALSAEEKKKLFGLTAVSVLNILEDSSDAYADLKGKVDEFNGSVDKTKESIDDAFITKLKRVLSAFQDISISVGEVSKPVTGGFLDFLGESLSRAASEFRTLTQQTREWDEALASLESQGLATDDDSVARYIALQRQAAQQQEVLNRQQEEMKSILEGINAEEKARNEQRKEQITFAKESISTISSEIDLERLRGNLTREVLNDKLRELEVINGILKANEAGVGSEVQLLRQKKAIMDELDALDKAAIDNAKKLADQEASQRNRKIRNIVDGGGNAGEKIRALTSERLAIQNALAEMDRQFEDSADGTSIEAYDNLLVTLQKVNEEITSIQDEEEQRAAQLLEYQQSVSLGFQTSILALEGLNNGITALSANIAGNLLNAITNLKFETRSFGDIFKQVLQQIAAQIISTAIKFAIFKTIVSVAGGGLTAGSGGALFTKALTGFNPVQPNASGRDEVIRKPTLLLAGEAGPERVRIDPKPGLRKESSGTGGGGLTVNINGDVYGEEKFNDAVNAAMEKINGRQYV